MSKIEALRLQVSMQKRERNKIKRESKCEDQVAVPLNVDGVGQMEFGLAMVVEPSEKTKNREGLRLILT